MPRNTFDPRHELPPVIGAEYDSEVTGTLAPTSANEQIITLPPAGGLRPPGRITVIESRVRQGPGGKDIVDLIIDVEDMPGATEYEVRVAS